MKKVLTAPVSAEKPPLNALGINRSVCPWMKSVFRCKVTCMQNGDAAAQRWMSFTVATKKRGRNKKCDFLITTAAVRKCNSWKAISGAEWCDVPMRQLHCHRLCCSAIETGPLFYPVVFILQHPGKKKKSRLYCKTVWANVKKQKQTLTPLCCHKTIQMKYQVRGPPSSLTSPCCKTLLQWKPWNNGFLHRTTVDVYCYLWHLGILRSRKYNIASSPVHLLIS